MLLSIGYDLPNNPAHNVLLIEPKLASRVQRPVISMVVVTLQNMHLDM